jgi:hypothetical protein
MNFPEVRGGRRGQDFVVILVFVGHVSSSQETTTLPRSRNKFVR